MKAAAPLCIGLGPSRFAGVLTSASFIATAALVAWLPSESASASVLKALAAIVIGAYAVGTLRRWSTRTAPSSIVSIKLSVDLRIALTERCGRRVEGKVLPDTYVGGWLTTIVMRPDGTRVSRRVAILYDMLAVDDFRRLRVLLRLGKERESNA